jgi:Ca-activated chloride channel homolog
MSNTIDETKLTAYALDELPTSDRFAVEAYLADHADARAAVAQIRQTAVMLSGELAREMAEPLPARSAMAISPRRRIALRWKIATAGIAAAAALAVAVGVYRLTLKQPQYLTNAGTYRTFPPSTDIISAAAAPISSAASKLDVAAIDHRTDTNAVKAAVTDNSAFRDANGNIVPSTATGASRTLDWQSNVGNAAVPGSIAANPGNYQGSLATASSSNTTGLSYFHGNVAGATSSGYRVMENGHVQYVPSSAETGPDTETYPRFADNSFLPALQNPLSTFSIDVDTASYANIRRFLTNNQLPPGDAVRIEEMVNYFPYDYAGPRSGDDSPVAVHVEVADCPWEPSHRLARVALKAKTVAPHERPASNLVFLIDVSGSMGDANKLDLLKKSLPMLVEHLTSDDHVAIVTYAGETAIALQSTACSDAAEPMSAEDTAAAQKLWDDQYARRQIWVNAEVVNEKEVKAEYENALAKQFHSAMSGKQRILSAIDNLNANGSTNGGAGILLAYSTAVSGYIKGGVNRVILATDGDFNVGVTDPDELVKMIEKQATTGVYLTVLGMGMGNVKDATMEKLADHGHGNYAYIDSLEEANKVLSRQVDSTLITVAKDVKVQVEFNPAKVAGYRLVGYEDRAMAREDFNNDQKSAGDMGAGHAVTALYEIVPNGVVMPAGVDPLKYQPAVNAPATNPAGNELMTVKIRYKQPENETSQKLEVPVEDTGESYAKASSDFRFASAVASFGMMLRNSPYKGNATFDAIIEDAGAAKGEDASGYRTEFVEMVKKAKAIADP